MARSRSFRGALLCWSRAGRGRSAPGRWYYVTVLAANGEPEATVRYRSRAGRNQALRRLRRRYPERAVHRLGPLPGGGRPSLTTPNR